MAMRLTYDPEADAAYIRLSDGPTAAVRELSDVCILDLAPDGILAELQVQSRAA